MLGGLSTATGLEVWGINMAELKFVAVGVSSIKAMTVDHRLHPFD